ncbi:TPA_asm: L [Medicago alphacytorhabdovirus 1]|nr:TPA_asm: L [Medicago alphacytorhabdovirus 1]
MDFVEKLREDMDDLVSGPSETPLSDYHLRNPLKEMTWWTRETLPSRQYKDRSKIKEIFGENVKPGHPSLIHVSTYEFLPQMDERHLRSALGDLWLRIKMDNGILPPSSRLPRDRALSAAQMVPRVYWNGMRFWNKVLLHLNAHSSNRKDPNGSIDIPSKLALEGKHNCIYIFRSCAALKLSHLTHAMIIDGDWIRMISDMYTQRWIVRVAAEIGRVVNPSHYPESRMIEKIYAWGDEVIRDLGNRGYAVIKTFEPLVIGYLQCQGESSLVPADRFLRNTLKDLREADVSFSKHAKSLLNILSESQNKHHLVQIYGLHRSWGHPTVDAEAGMAKILKIGKKNIIRDSRLSVNAGRMFKFLFCKEYKSKYGSYPKIRDCQTLLSTELQENDPAATQRGSHDLSEWDRIRFKQTYKWPETFNLSMIVADKAISPTRSELKNLIENKGTVMDSDLRRGVKRWLNDKSLDPIEFLTNINDGIFPTDHLIIGLTPKERELNTTPRMFTLMSHLLRVYIVITEQLLSDHILGMFPQITMTDSLLDLTRKMYSTVKNQSSLKKRGNKDRGWVSRTVCISLDFEKWNGHMRKEMTSGVFTAIGELFGLPELYNKTYDLFSQSYYYLADGSYVPKISASSDLVIEEPLSFINHQGGMEGLRQKGWTLYTVCGLEVILSKYDCEYKIMGMGDNQVLQITVYTNLIDHTGAASEAGMLHMAKTLRLIFEDLVKSFTDSGLPLKPLETWMSEDLYLYGKVPIWKGVPLTMDLKKLMRTFAMSNEGIMTLENSLSTVSSNALAATQVSPCIWTAYTIYIIMSSLCIEDFFDYHPILGESLYHKEHERFGNKKWVLRSRKAESQWYTIPDDAWKLQRSRLRQLIAIVPKSLSGYCGANIYEMMVRGFSDRLSRDLSYLNNIIISPQTPTEISKFLKRWMSPIYMPECNYSMLLEDVCAVNLLSPRSPTSGVRQVVNRYLENGMKIQNPEFMQLVRAKNDQDCRYLAECLCEGRELHVRLLHDVYDATVFGYVDSILSKVTKTTTIQRLAIQSDSVRVFDTIVSDERNYFNFFLWRCFSEGAEMPSKCATTQCKIMREKGWNKIIRGVTVPFPLSFLIETNCGHIGACSCEDGYLSIHYPDKQMTNDMWNFDIGGNPPYLGSMTKEKVVVGTGGKIYSAEPLIKRPINLLRTINWFVPDNSIMARVISACAQSVTDLDVKRFKGMLEGTAGSEAHRYQDSSTFRGALSSSNYLFSTRCHISTDNLTRYSKGAENTDFHYQAAFCVMLELSNMYLSYCISNDKMIDRFKHFKQCCYECIQPVEEDFVDLMSDKSLSVIPCFKDNKYLYTSADRIRILERISPLYDKTDRVLTSEQYDNMSPEVKSIMLHRSICDRIVKDIITGRSSETHVSVGLTSVKSYERTMYFKLDPKIMIDTVMTEIRRFSSWTVLKSHPERTKASDGDVTRVAINLINKSDTHSFLGLAMFFCWEETAMRYSRTYVEIVPPTTNPISVASACESVRSSLLALIDRRLSGGISRGEVILSDEQSELLVYKMLLYDSLSSKTRCSACLASLARLETGDIWRDFNLTICYYGHKLSDWINRIPWVRSYITIERLRKDCSSPALPADRPEIRVPGGSRSNNFLLNLLSCHTVRCRGYTSEYQPPPETVENISSGITAFHLATVGTLPTSTIYKIQDVIGGSGLTLRNKKCFCVGDGLGSSSAVLRMLGADVVYSSTMLEPDDAIPHAYAHNTIPVPHSYGVDNVMSQNAVERHNDVRSDGWEKDWSWELKNCEVLYSDAEIINPNDHESRYLLMKKMLLSNRRDLTVIKDYIWSAEELSNKIGLIWSSGSLDWLLITSKFRSLHYPEVWWIVKDTNPKKEKPPVYPLVDTIRTKWMEIKDILIESDYHISESDNELIGAMTPPEVLVKMVTWVRSWCTFPAIGSLMPKGGTFTSLYYYLLKAKRPISVKYSDKETQRLYQSDYLELRSKMFAIAVSMLADIDERLSMMRESEMWGLKWKRYADKWEISLERSEDTFEPSCDVVKYIPTLNILMMKEGLLFKKRGNCVEFKSDRKREELCYPVTKLSVELRRPAIIKNNAEK